MARTYRGQNISEKYMNRRDLKSESKRTEFKRSAELFSYFQLSINHSVYQRPGKGPPQRSRWDNPWVHKGFGVVYGLTSWGRKTL